MTGKWYRIVTLPNGNDAKMHVTKGEPGECVHGYVYAGGRRVYGTSPAGNALSYYTFAPIGKYAQLVQTSVAEEAEAILASV